jgi:hypothetical protein
LATRSESEIELTLDPDVVTAPDASDTDRARSRERRFFAVTFGVTLAVAALFLVRILLYTKGHLVYVIDDPGIHLAMARNLVEHGTWGVSPGVYESASSSPAWTLMLAGVTGAVPALASVVPLVVNLAAAAWILWIYATRQHVVVLGRGHWGSWALAIVLPLWALFLPALAFTGMEHTLHAALALQVVVLLTLLVAGEATPRRWAAYYVLLTLGSCFRLETMFVAAGCGAALLFATTRRLGGSEVATAWPVRRRLVHTVATGVAAGVPVLVIGLVNLAFDRRFFPNSVVAKTALGQDESLIPTWDAVLANLERDVLLATLFALAVAYLIFTAYGFRGRNSALAMAFAVTALLHFGFASIGWYHRYQAYLIVIGLLFLLRAAPEVVRPRWREAALLCLAVAILLFSLGRLHLLSSTPLAASNTYRQQYQLGRFMDRYYGGEPVAVQDLGYVALLHDGPVVDINGLGSHEILKLRQDDAFDQRAMRRIVDREDVQAIALFANEYVFRLPNSWIGVGEWSLGQKKVSPLYSTVTFYAPNERLARELEGNLRDFRSELPDGVETADREQMIENALRRLGEPEEPSEIAPTQP